MRPWRARAVNKHLQPGLKMLTTASAPPSELTQKLNEALTECARLERELQASRATVEAHTRTIAELTVRLTEERLNTSVLREHIAACTDWMRTADSD